MEKWFDLTLNSALAIVISCLGIYISIIIYTRIFGKRSFSKMSSFDFAMTVAVGSMLATTVLSDSVTLPEGMIGLFFIYLFQLVAAYLRRWDFFREAIDNSPLLLMDGNNILHDNLKKARVTVTDLRSKLRESNIIELEDVKAVVFETTGNIVVIHSQDNRSVNNWLLDDVKRS
ncbi:DUF421 domain-containing protein [Christiangramia portivictoriae]|uniref:DUF421 domain-containing protein n=1 Tax=Christiangramia portivictoriae TaxID=326069 RepID=UPI00041DB3E5|nr:YetF domain-containing protein [Christiangramia portivictoriae]